jgi:hypothetical protein
MRSMSRNQHFYPGDVVVVRPPAEILATLDERGCLDAVPFMPEMLQFVGKRFTVSRRVEKICDTISGAYGSRRMPDDVVFLEQLRCDGSSHGGCQAECRLYWKEAWLEKASSQTSEVSDGELNALEERARAGLHSERKAKTSDPIFRCQATEALRATAPLSAWAPGQYVRELASRNIGFASFLAVFGRAAAWELTSKCWGLFRRIGMLGPPHTGGACGKVDEALSLQPGDLVQVRNVPEIFRTLGPTYRNRGLLFARAEMLPACGKQFRVRRRVEKIVDEATGRLLTFKNDCVTLEGFVCTGDRSAGRYFCAREMYPYWREAWLRRVEEVAAERVRAPRPAAPVPGIVASLSERVVQAKAALRSWYATAVFKLLKTRRSQRAQ